ncbi:hypothetical protein Anapl_13056 [Anas platyrhynchos]|uniref:Uncharacterized protein n=1 Tax=Anas platyrhynchos TaxID=8839 RepID=R0L290_ANAPL|nr:hypothetical protein Anapl_13056 [Anas platyrhynchos]
MEPVLRFPLSLCVLCSCLRPAGVQELLLERVHAAAALLPPRFLRLGAGMVEGRFFLLFGAHRSPAALKVCDGRIVSQAEGPILWSGGNGLLAPVAVQPRQGVWPSILRQPKSKRVDVNAAFTQLAKAAVECLSSRGIQCIKYVIDGHFSCSTIIHISQKEQVSCSCSKELVKREVEKRFLPLASSPGSYGDVPAAQLHLKKRGWGMLAATTLRVWLEAEKDLLASEMGKKQPPITDQCEMATSRISARSCQPVVVPLVLPKVGKSWRARAACRIYFDPSGPFCLDLTQAAAVWQRCRYRGGSIEEHDENTELTNTEFRLRALLPGTAPFIQRLQFHSGMRQKHP